MRWFTARGGMAWGVVLLLAIAGVRGDQGAAPAAADARLKAAVAFCDRMAASLSDELNQPLACPWDVPGQAAALGGDPDKIFAFVRNQVRYEPCRGILRGSRGALTCRAANAADKSLLLSELLRASGHKCRIVVGKLNAQQSGQLVKDFFDAWNVKNRPGLGEFLTTTEPTQQEFQQYGQSHGLDGTALRNEALREEAEARSSFEDAMDSADRESQAVLAAIKSANVTMGRSAAAWKQELELATADHAWVQQAKADGWVDLDPSFRDAKPGQKFAEGEKEAGGDFAPRHELQFKLIYRRTVGSGEDSQTILDAHVPAEGAFIDSAAFGIHPVWPAPPSIEQMLKMDAPQLAEMIGNFKKFQAILHVGGKAYSSQAFDLEGNVFDTTADPDIAAVQGVGGGIGGGFGGLAGGGGRAPANQFMSLEVQFIVKSPGKPDQVQRRVLTSAVGPKQKPRSPILDWEILPLPGPIPESAAEYAAARQVLATATPVIEMFRSGGPSAADAQAYLQDLPSFPTVAMQFALMRQRGLAELLSRRPGVAMVWDSMDLFVVERRTCLCHPAAGVQEADRFDIVSNALSLVPRDDAESGAAEATLHQGIFDTVAEGELLQTLLEGVEIHSAAADLQRGRLAGGLIPVTAQDPAALNQTSLTEADRAWVKAFETGDRVLLASHAGNDAPSAWWSFDPATGVIVGRSAGGGGQADTEYKTLVTNMVDHFTCIAGVLADAIKLGRNMQAGKFGLAGAKSAATVIGAFAKCTSSLAGANWSGPTTWGAAFKSAKGLYGGLAGMVDALAG